MGEMVQWPDAIMSQSGICYTLHLEQNLKSLLLYCMDVLNVLPLATPAYVQSKSLHRGKQTVDEVRVYYNKLSGTLFHIGAIILQNTA